MPSLVVGEGKNDLWFIHEIITQKLAIDPCTCGMYTEIKDFENDVNFSGQKPLSLICGGGSNMHKVAVRVTRPFWIKRAQITLGVVGDTDNGCIYARLKDYLNHYIRDRQRVPVLTPIVDYNDEEKRFVLKPKPNRIIPVWTSEIPESLEVQIERVLKRKYPDLDSSLNDDETIQAVSAKLGTTVEYVVRNSTNLLENKTWFRNLTCKLRQDLV